MVLRSLLTPSRYAVSAYDHPFVSLHRVLRSMDDTLGRPAPMSFRIDVQENEKAYSVTAELAGLHEKDVEVTFDEGVLTIRGEKKVERDESKDTWHVTERAQGTFERQIALPASVDEAAIEAKFDKGVLTVILPKQAEPEKTAKKIAIKTN